MNGPKAGRWGPDDIGDLTGTVALVTGANSGIGHETAVELAAHGAHVVLACRDRVKGHQAADHIVGNAAGASVELLVVDLASQSSVHAAARRFTDEHGRLDILVNNAGVMAAPFEFTEDGFERQFATNHLGPFALTGLLLDRMRTLPGSRIVTISSALHRLGHLDLASAERLQGLAGGHNRWLAYGNTKLANLLFTYELDRRLAGGRRGDDRRGRPSRMGPDEPGDDRAGDGRVGRPGPGRPVGGPPRAVGDGRRPADALRGDRPRRARRPVLRSRRAGRAVRAAGPGRLEPPVPPTRRRGPALAAVGRADRGPLPSRLTLRTGGRSPVDRLLPTTGGWPAGHR